MATVDHVSEPSVPGTSGKSVHRLDRSAREDEARRDAAPRLSESLIGRPGK